LSWLEGKIWHSAYFLTFIESKLTSYPPPDISLAPPRTSISWGKREPQTELLPTRGYVSWGRDAPPEPTLKHPKPSLSLIPSHTRAPIPTTFITPGPKPPVSYPVPSACTTTTILVSPPRIPAIPCIPPLCPLDKIACDVNKVERVEKVVLTLKTVVRPSIGKPTPTNIRCSGTATTTVFVPCPTYTCVPNTWCGA